MLTVVPKLASSVGSIEGSAFIIVSSDSGLYLKGTLTEYQLNGGTWTNSEVMSWDTGNSYIASITEIYHTQSMIRIRMGIKMFLSILLSLILKIPI